jgi:hypothetical protein
MKVDSCILALLVHPQVLLSTLSLCRRFLVQQDLNIHRFVLYNSQILPRRHFSANQRNYEYATHNKYLLVDLLTPPGTRCSGCSLIGLHAFIRAWRDWIGTCCCTTYTVQYSKLH